MELPTEKKRMKNSLSVSCEPELAHEFKAFCFQNHIRYSHPLAEFMQHFLKSKGKVNFRKDFTRGMDAKAI